MRLDKFLKVSRIIKRRTVARDFADNDRITVNGRIAKPATLVKKGDRIVIRSGNKETGYEVLEIKDNIKASEAADLYKILE